MSDLGYYDRDGNPLDQPEALSLFGQDRHVAETDIGDYWVSTVHLVLDHGYGEGHKPLIFETMVFAGEDMGDDLYCERYSTLREAQVGHDVAVAWVRDLIARSEHSPAL